MLKSRKRSTADLPETPKRKNLTRRRKRREGAFGTVSVSFVIGCAWLAILLGALILHLRSRPSIPVEHNSDASPPANKRLDFKGLIDRAKQNRIPMLRRQDRDGNDGPEIPETGLKHIPELQPLSDDPDAYRSPLLIFTCRRQQYLSQTMDDILENIGDRCGFGCPVVVSEDGSHAVIAQVIAEYLPKFQAKGVPLMHMQHHQVSVGNAKRLRQAPASAYEALAQHYGWALSQVFDGVDPSLPKPDRVMILEEDIHTSVDFFSYMKATSRLLDHDKSLLAVSAYNDNGHMAADPYRILRSDFFPGLGWMMNRRLWKEELESKWPKGYWDDWLREPAQRQGRHILRPEFSRTFHFGSEGGTSHNQFGSILTRVKLNQENVDWSQVDFSNMNEEAFDNEYSQLVAESTEVKSIDEAYETLKSGHNARLEYTTINHFKSLADKLDIMDDEKANIPRTAYKGVVELRPFGTYILFLTPTYDKLKEAFPTISRWHLFLSLSDMHKRDNVA